MIDKKRKWQEMRENIIGLGESSNRKSYFPELKRKITELETTQNELRQSEQNLNNLFNTIGDAIIIHLTDGSVVDVNDTMLVMYNVTRETFRNYTIQDYSAPQLLNEYSVQEMLDELQLKGQALFNWKARRPVDNSFFDVEVSLRKYLWYGQDAVVAVVRDITNRRKAELALRQSEYRLRAIMDAVPSMIFVKNASGRFIKANKAVTDIIGMKIGELDGKYYSELSLANNQLKEILKKNYQTAESKNNNPVITTENYTDNKGNIQWLQTLVMPCSEIIFGEPVIVVIAVNITDIKQAEEKLHNTNTELEEAKKKAEENNRLKSAFLSNMSHEIRTPMNGILGFINIMQDMDLTEEMREKYISNINKSGYRLLNTVDDIMELSKIETEHILINKEKVKPHNILKNLYSVFKTLADQKGLELIYLESKEIENITLETDQKKLEKILSNLIKNAIKFTNKGNIEIFAHLDKETIIFSIKDSGKGIPDKKISIIFDNFVQGDINIDRGYEGVGLGLSIARAYAGKLGGEIWVESKKDQGSIFYLSLPLS